MHKTCKLLRWLSVEQAVAAFEECLKSRLANASTSHKVERPDGDFALTTTLALLHERLLCLGQLRQAVDLWRSEGAHGRRCSLGNYRSS